MGIEEQLEIYQILFRIGTLLSLGIGMFLGLQACLQLSDSSYSFRGTTSSSLFMHSFISLFLVYLLGMVSSDFGFIDKPLLRIFLKEAIENVTGWKTYAWTLLALISAIILTLGFGYLMQYESNVRVLKKVMVFFLIVYSLEAIQYLYFDFIK